MSTQPVSIDAQATHVVIQWADHTYHRLDNRVLRGNCPCAICNDFRDRGERIEVRAEIRANKLWLVGGYALGIAWSDGHSDGLYSFDTLFELGQVS